VTFDLPPSTRRAKLATIGPCYTTYTYGINKNDRKYRFDKKKRLNNLLENVSVKNEHDGMYYSLLLCSSYVLKRVTWQGDCIADAQGICQTLRPGDAVACRVQDHIET